MLAIRLQRLGRSGYPTYRIAVQEAQRHPSSGRVVTYVGSYNPHSKQTTLDVEKISYYLSNGAQPTPRVVKILVEQKVKLPDWVVKHTGKKQVAVKHAEKLRKNTPKEEPTAAAAPEVEAPSEPVVEEVPVESPATTDEASE
ncbi:30S ribosomal protein S16 [Candidatus Saccharibacteria bacterium]|nr:30S ribosomal protein S16 [Candidatus Saccharibacteria bacterium]